MFDGYTKSSEFVVRKKDHGRIPESSVLPSPLKIFVFGSVHVGVDCFRLEESHRGCRFQLSRAKQAGETE